MDPERLVIVIKGAGEKASAVALRLFVCGFHRIAMTEIENPAAERRAVSFCEAMFEKQKSISGVTALMCEPKGPRLENNAWEDGMIALCPDPSLAILEEVSAHIFIDATMMKKNRGTHIGLAPCVIALGPGFYAGKDAHFVIETNPESPFMGGVITGGEAEKNTGLPPSVSGLSSQRIIRSPDNGMLECQRMIGDRVKEGEKIGRVNNSPLLAPASGVIWGIVRNGLTVKKGRRLATSTPGGCLRPVFRSPHTQGR